MPTTATTKRRPGERGPQLLPTKSDRRRWLATLKQRADDGDAQAIIALLTLTTQAAAQELT